MTQEFIIKNWTIDLNAYINAERRNRFSAANIKKEWTEIIATEVKAQKIKSMQTPISIFYEWIMPNAKKDRDNVMFGQKFIQDGLVKAGIIKNDGWNDIFIIQHVFEVDRTSKPKVIVTLTGPKI